MCSGECQASSKLDFQFNCNKVAFSIFFAVNLRTLLVNLRNVTNVSKDIPLSEPNDTPALS